MSKMNIEEAIETVKEIKNLKISYYRPATYIQEIKFYLNEEQRQAIETVLADRENLINRNKELERLHISDNKHLDYLMQNSIPTSAIKEKIEELLRCVSMALLNENINVSEIESQVEVLEELLEKEK